MDLFYHSFFFFILFLKNKYKKEKLHETKIKVLFLWDGCKIHVFFYLLILSSLLFFHLLFNQLFLQIIGEKK